MQRVIIELSLIWLLPKTLGTSHPQQQQQHILYQTSSALCPLESPVPWRAPSICPSNGLAATSNNETSTVQQHEWTRGDVCHELPGDPDTEFCTFTHLSFNGGLGISIVTTPEVFEKVSALPVFAGQGAVGPAAGGRTAPPVPYRDVPVAGKGIGLVAAARLGPGEVYMARTPAVMLDDAAFRLLGRARLTRLLARAVDDLPRGHRAEYLNLTTHSDVGAHEDRVYAIFMKNNFQTTVQDVSLFHSTFTQVSRLNHACRPNSDYFFDDRTLSHNVFAAREVDVGEELTITYADPFQPYVSRQNNLMRHWGFQCTCSLCTASDADVARSDARIAEIRGLWPRLDDYSLGPSAVHPGEAERLLELYREEGLVTRMVEGYYRAAVEYNGAGDSERARRSAERSIEEGEVMEGGIRPFMDNMRALARDPRAHWTWRFRLRNGGG